MPSVIALVIASVLLVPGIFMAGIPMLPALSYMFVVALAFAAYGGFVVLDGVELCILLGIVLVSVVIDHGAGILGAKYGGAHTKSLVWGVAGAIIGTFVFPVLGSFIGLFLAILAAEIYYKKPHDKALKAAGGAVVGSIVGVVANIVLALVFFGIFLFFSIS